MGCGYQPQHLSLTPSNQPTKTTQLALGHVSNHTFFAGLETMFRGALRKQFAQAASIVQVANKPGAWQLTATVTRTVCTRDTTSVATVILVTCSVAARIELQPPRPASAPTSAGKQSPSLWRRPSIGFGLSRTASYAENNPTQTISAVESPGARNAALNNALKELAHQVVEQVFLRTAPFVR